MRASYILLHRAGNMLRVRLPATAREMRGGVGLLVVVPASHGKGEEGWVGVGLVVVPASTRQGRGDGVWGWWWCWLASNHTRA